MTDGEKRQCSQRVGGIGFGGHRCAKPATIERGGKFWCSIHDPVRVAERRAARYAKWDADAEARRVAADAHAARERRRDECEVALPRVTAERDEALAALRAASGYFLNAKISLEVGTKRSGIDLIEGGLRVVQAVLAKHASVSNPGV